ncbi:MAG: signal peptidase II [Acutalibacteraceae bacterium]
MTAIITAIVIAALTAVDQIIKHYVCLNLKPIGTKMLIDGVLQLDYVENTGAMMGLLKDKTTLMAIAACVVLIVLFILIATKKIKFGFVYCCIVMIVAGGLGNIIDRIFRGFVVDYIEVLFVDFYVFNFADCLITVGAFLIIGYEIYDAVRASKQKKVKENA